MRSTHVLAQAPSARAGRREPRRSTAWLSARLRAPWLDRQLAAGVAPWRSPAHAARSLQLTSDRSRRLLARSLERLVEDAEHRPMMPFRGAAVTPCRAQVCAALPLILALSAQLCDGGPVEAAGVARLRALLSDGTGPCYARIHRDALTNALQAASEWLEVQD